MTLHLPPAAVESLDLSILERRSIRSFRPDPVSRALVTELLETACWAPSPHNSQPWRFTVLFDDADKQRLADMMAGKLEEDLRVQGVDHEEIGRQSSRSRARIASAPVVILCSLTPDGLVQHRAQCMRVLEWQMAVQSVGTVLQTLFLLAHTRGLGTCWMAAPMYCPELVREALELPDDFVPQALVLMGYSAREGKRRVRRAPDEVIELR